MSDAINPVDWFEIPVNDIARATAFYQRALGVTLKPMEQGPMKMAWFTGQPGGSGANGMLVQGPGRTPSKTGTLVYFTVPEIDAALASVERAGGKVVLPKASGDYGSIAHFEDSDGNLVALHQPPK
ncbi:MAG: VOC family protein [Acidobacteria bacterium]|nr:MAG: VOC family protein [Acidobacteriota bacterium]PYQ78558.1 MAG: VOC family protein [Acidobacteriota bacterium]PYQ90272.1 MAG: VOC family protein [Acidobacteriota bacterium]PYQ92206.1 MAG: VOC family protein [Acidobacteriota bacterium]PYR10904.1 MAG: VOC family protein [Acidobacteriota bacterium]